MLLPLFRGPEHQLLLLCCCCCCCCCRFCMASYLTLPFRSAPLEGSLIPTLERGLAVTDRVGLLGECWGGVMRTSPRHP